VGLVDISSSHEPTATDIRLIDRLVPDKARRHRRQRALHVRPGRDRKAFFPQRVVGDNVHSGMALGMSKLPATTGPYKAIDRDHESRSRTEEG
jgi:hypothetical protein